MGYNGENTTPAQRRTNLRNSKARLMGLLSANFQDGAQLVTLTYGENVQTPSRELAELQVQDCLRVLRGKSGQRLRYIRATEREKPESYPVHRVVLPQSQATVDALVDLWEYGPVIVEPVQNDGLETLAALLMAQVLNDGRQVVPCSKVWSASKGLIRTGKGKTKDGLLNPYGGRVPQSN